MNNATNKEIFKFRMNSALEKFQRQPNDTGTPAVQGIRFF